MFSSTKMRAFSGFSLSSDLVWCCPVLHGPVPIPVPALVSSTGRYTALLCSYSRGVYVGAARLPQEEVPLTKLLGKPEHPMAGQTSGSPAKPLTGRQ